MTSSKVAVASVIALRVLLAFVGTAYIHPDENIQSLEVIAREFLGLVWCAVVW